MPKKRRYSSEEDIQAASEESPTYRTIHEKLLDDRVIFITGEINSNLVSNLIPAFIYLNNRNHEPITAYVNSEGGTPDAMLGLIDHMHILESPVKTVCIQEASSCGALILAAGTPGMRYATANSKVMIHECWIDEMTGVASDLVTESKSLKKLNKKLTELLAKFTGQSVDTIYEDYKKGDKYFSAKQAKEYGLIDHVLKPKK